MFKKLMKNHGIRVGLANEIVKYLKLHLSNLLIRNKVNEIIL